MEDVEEDLRQTLKGNKNSKIYKMKLINKKENQVTFVAEMDEGLANAIRRYLNYVDILAVDEVEIVKNDSAIYDETLAHRIGLVPLKMIKSVNKSGVEKFSLKVKKEGFVHSEELDGKLKVVFGDIPLTFLNKGQELELNAVTKFGKGIEHTKFAPGLMFYRNVFDLKIDKDCPSDVVSVCPKKILDASGGKVKVTDNVKCDMCESCVEFCKKKGKDSIEINQTNELMITLESFGQLGVEDVFGESIAVLKSDLAEVSKKIK